MSLQRYKLRQVRGIAYTNDYPNVAAVYLEPDENGPLVMHADHVAEMRANSDAYHDEVNRLADLGEREGRRYADELAQERKRLTAELEALRADAERYRWLREKATWYHCYITNTMKLQEKFSADVNGLDAAIDAAREGK